MINAARAPGRNCRSSLTLNSYDGPLCTHPRTALPVPRFPTYGNHGLPPNGFTAVELKKLGVELGDRARLVMLSDALPEEEHASNEAAVLHIKGGINLLMGRDTYADEMLAEQKAVKYDESYIDQRECHSGRMHVPFSEIMFSRQSVLLVTFTWRLPKSGFR